MKKLLCVAALFLLAVAVLADNPHTATGTVVVAKQSILNQRGPVADTTIFTPGVDGDFRVSVYLEAFSFTNGTVNVAVCWTDDFRTVGTNLNIGPTASVDYNASAVIHAKANTPIFLTSGPNACTGSSTTNANDPYNVFVSLESLP